MKFERHIRELVAHLLHADWEKSMGDFIEAEKDFNKELEAAVTDRWVEWRRERVNGVLHNRAAVVCDDPDDSGVDRRGPDPQQDVGGRRVGELARVNKEKWL